MKDKVYKGYVISDELKSSVLVRGQDEHKYSIYIQGTTKCVAVADTIPEAKEKINDLLNHQ